MKKIIMALFVLSILVLSVGLVSAAKAKKGEIAGQCVTIQDGVLTYSDGHYLDEELLTVGYDQYGYNYQGHFFKGSYANVYLGGAGFPPYQGEDVVYLEENPLAENHWAWPYRSTKLSMKWNDAWISNKDCDGDGSLDRHYDFDSYIGSGAWETNHMWDSYESEGKTCNWNYFTKIIAVPADATKTGGVWYSVDGTEIGPDIWGEFATILDVYNDPCDGYHGVEYLSPTSAGFGYYKP